MKFERNNRYSSMVGIRPTRINCLSSSGHFKCKERRILKSGRTQTGVSYVFKDKLLNFVIHNNVIYSNLMSSHGQLRYQFIFVIFQSLGLYGLKFCRMW
jgi:hypothetical protein